MLSRDLTDLFSFCWGLVTAGAVFCSFKAEPEVGSDSASLSFEQPEDSGEGKADKELCNIPGLCCCVFLSLLNVHFAPRRVVQEQVLMVGGRGRAVPSHLECPAGSGTFLWHVCV